MGRAAAGEIEGGSASRSPDVSLELPSTSHMVVVDASGNAVSMTASIESAFGSRLMVRGFLLNNELTDFSFVAEDTGRKVANRIAPGKRPRSSMAPFLVFQREDDERRFHLAIGSPGGSRIIEYVARTLLQVLDGGLDVQTAIARPNVVNRNGETELERNGAWMAWIESTREGLKQRGHEVEVRDLNSGLQGISRVDEGYLGGADPRRVGLILGD
jgi:gamma-glutamyltranspeptidase/glutathione hydrolase